MGLIFIVPEPVQNRQTSWITYIQQVFHIQWN